jgi:hypothetical protein
MTDIGELAARFEAVIREKRRLETELRQVTQLADQLEAEVVDAMSSAGLQNLSTATSTIYLANEVWARPIDEVQDILVERLDAEGLGDIARRRVQTQTLSAIIRSHLDLYGEPPAWAEGTVIITTRPRVRVRAR